jgi:hypothetical protein
VFACDRLYSQLTPVRAQTEAIQNSQSLVFVQIRLRKGLATASRLLSLSLRSILHCPLDVLGAALKFRKRVSLALLVPFDFGGVAAGVLGELFRMSDLGLDSYKIGFLPRQLFVCVPDLRANALFSSPCPRKPFRPS